MTSTLPGTAAPAILGNRYRVGPLLGQGGMSDVHRAHDAVTGQEVAVKVYRWRSDALDVDRRQRREVELGRRLDHPGLVRMIDADCGSVPAYVVLELVEGETLAQRVRRAPLDEPETLRVAAVLADALAYLHDHGILHRDVKPANVLLDRAGHPKLTDFGIAYMVDSTRMTVEGFTVGTPNYLSPEQVTGDSVDVRSDIYSLGLVLIEALTGAPVYPGSGIEAAVARLHRDPRSPAEVSRGFAALLRAMTARDPRHRPSADEVRRRCAELMDGRVPRHHTRDLLLAVQRSPRRRALAALGTVGSIAAATIGTLLVMSPEAAPSQSQTPAARAGVPAHVRPASPSSAAARKAARPAAPVAARPTATRPAGPTQVALARAAAPRVHSPAPAHRPKPPGHAKHGHHAGHGKSHGKRH